MTAARTIIEVADAMVAEIAAAEQAGQFEGLRFDPVRSYADYTAELKELGCLHVDVLPFGYKDSTLRTRGTIGYLVTNSIVVRKQFGPEQRDGEGTIKREEVDRLIQLIQELHEFFIARRLGAMPEAVWHEASIAVTYDYDLLCSPGIFAGMVQVTYDAPRDLP